MRKLRSNIITNEGNIRRSFVVLALLTFALISFWVPSASAQQPAILGAAGTSNRAVVFPDGNTPGIQNLVPGLPANASPHAVAYFGSDSALISDFNNGRVHVVQISTASLVSTINTLPSYSGMGSIAVAPNLTAALAMANTTTLSVIQSPFVAGATITTVTLPGIIGTYQTQAIVFNNAGRAFVYHSTGISVLDAPYTSIAFTIPVAGNASTGALAISPDGNTLLSTLLSGNTVRIFQGPFSAATTSTSLTIPSGNGMDGIMIAPDGTRAIVVSAFVRHAAAILAPFSPASTVQTLPLPAGGGTSGFEDVGISADSQIAILTGNGLSAGDLAVFVQAPFGSTSTTSLVPINGVANPDRGAGAVRFLPPGLAPGLTISKSAPSTVASGANLTYTINYANTGTANATNVVIRDPLPAGTTFVSASNGGTLVSGSVVFNIGTLVANSGTQSVSFTVTVNTAQGGTVNNNNYTIEGDGITPVPGPPVTTSVSGATATATSTPTATFTPTNTATDTPTNTATDTPTNTATDTPTATSTATFTPTAAGTPSCGLSGSREESDEENKINLSTEGTADWAHWGLDSPTSFNHKNGVTQQISDYTALGTGEVLQFKNSVSYFWNDGTPTATANTDRGVYVIGLGNGFQVTAPADTTPRTLKIYLGLYRAGGRLEASLSDNSSPAFVDTSRVNPTSASNDVYTINYCAASSGQTLTIKWTVDTSFDQFANVTLQAATLVDGAATPTATATETFTPTATATATATSTPGGGSLSGSQGVTPANVNLSAEGTADWAHWGLNTPASFNHKNGVTQQISNFSVLGMGPILRFKNTIFYNWSGGTPTASANTRNGVYVIGLNNGFQITAPADTTARTLKVYVGVYAAGGRFEASLSDGSAPDYVDTSLVNTTSTSNGVYTLNYSAASAGQTLTIRWIANETFNQFGNVTLQAATLTP
ncbi:MAG: hypothetical protein ACKVRN_14585 [Pyrinomonadaceae bacterium]